MTTPETAVFKMRIGNAPHVSGRVSLALVGTTIGRANMFQIADHFSRFTSMFSPNLKANISVS